MVKKGRHRRYEEARQLKRNSAADDIEALMETIDDDPFDLSVTTTDDDDADLDPDEESPYKDGSPYKR